MVTFISAGMALLTSLRALGFCEPGNAGAFAMSSVVAAVYAVAMYIPFRDGSVVILEGMPIH